MKLVNARHRATATNVAGDGFALAAEVVGNWAGLARQTATPGDEFLDIKRLGSRAIGLEVMAYPAR
ncbi:hypothetical protein [Ottowia sp.]|uniref:hypothetical protein n=1 Tax=Ottowia sp. TaxID=1898956 RepID=UPI0025DC4917|nr:hypothetical protein [Ottowia sp.]MBK6616327.1 hypothetical protein [Ottowia sp.]